MSAFSEALLALHRAVDEANLAVAHAQGEDAAPFLIEVRVRRLLPI